MTGDFDLFFVDPGRYAAALAEAKGGRPHPIAAAICSAFTEVANAMQEHEATCLVCDKSDKYLFAPGEPSAVVVVSVPAEDSTSIPAAEPVCEACARLSDAQKRERLRAAVQRTLPEARERMAH